MARQLQIATRPGPLLLRPQRIVLQYALLAPVAIRTPACQHVDAEEPPHGPPKPQV